VNPVKSKKPTKRYELQGLYINKTLPSRENQAILESLESLPGNLACSQLSATGTGKRGSLIALPAFPHLEEERSLSFLQMSSLLSIDNVASEARRLDQASQKSHGYAKEYWKKPYFETSLCVCTSPGSGSLDLGVTKIVSTVPWIMNVVHVTALLGMYAQIALTQNSGLV